MITPAISPPFVADDQEPNPWSPWFATMMIAFVGIGLSGSIVAIVVYGYPGILSSMKSICVKVTVDVEGYHSVRVVVTGTMMGVTDG